MGKYYDSKLIWLGKCFGEKKCVFDIGKKREKYGNK